MNIVHMHPLTKIEAMLEDSSSSLHAMLLEMYGSRDLLAEPLDLLRRTVREFGRSFGRDRRVFIMRSTGRINLLGIHVDHRGGSVNPIAIKEAFFIVEPRDDDRVVLRDIDGDKYPEESFRISECLPVDKKVEDWDGWCHAELEKRKGQPGITFSNYFRGGVLCFQNMHRDASGRFNPVFKGMNMMIGSNLTPAAGLSTSSCMSLGATESILHVNGIKMDPMHLCEQSGPAEWYVGTRGGFSDQAAIKLGKCGSIQHMTSAPFTVETLPFPKGYRVVLADSMVQAKKQAGAKDGYNMPLAAYAFGLWLIQKKFPALAPKIQRLRDVAPARLGISDAEVFRIIKSLPESVSRNEILAMLPEKEAEIRTLFRSHNEPKDGYKVRRVCMYGISECIRADLAGAMLKEGDIQGFGKLISLHHDGDRVTRLVKGEMVPVVKDYADARMDQLIAAAEKPGALAGNLRLGAIRRL